MALPVATACPAVWIVIIRKFAIHAADRANSNSHGQNRDKRKPRQVKTATEFWLAGLDIFLTVNAFTWSFSSFVTRIMKMIVDDHAGLQTLPVSIKKPICVDCNFCSCSLNELIEVASSRLTVNSPQSTEQSN